MTPELQDLIDRLRRRDAAALREIAEQHSRRIYRTARGLGFGPTEAEDLTQDVFVTFLDTLDHFEGRSAVSTWLFGILHRKAHEYRRTRSRDERHDPIDAGFESQFDACGHWTQPPTAADRLVDARAVAEAIRRCLDGLSPLQREVFLLRQLEELTAADVSKMLGQTVTHVGVLFHRARMKLRQCLDNMGWGRAR